LWKVLSNPSKATVKCHSCTCVQSWNRSRRLSHAAVVHVQPLRQSAGWLQQWGIWVPTKLQWRRLCWGWYGLWGGIPWRQEWSRWRPNEQSSQPVMGSSRLPCNWTRRVSPTSILSLCLLPIFSIPTCAVHFQLVHFSWYIASACHVPCLCH